jgi:hypothetical protein
LWEKCPSYGVGEKFRFSQLGFPVDVVSGEIQRFAQKHEGRLHHHENVQAIQLLDNSCIVGRLQREKTF